MCFVPNRMSHPSRTAAFSMSWSVEDNVSCFLAMKTDDVWVRRIHARLSCYRDLMHVLLRKLAFTFGFAGILGALLIVAVQGVSWFEFGTWPQVTVIHGLVALGFPTPTSTWPVIQKAIDTVLGVPISVLVPVIGVGLRMIFWSLATKFQPRGLP
jgi:hypothetical protein